LAVTDIADRDDSESERHLPPPAATDPRTSFDRRRTAGPDGLSLWSFTGSLIVIFGASLIVLAGLVFLATFWLGFPETSPHKPLAIADEFNLIKIILGIIAGAGGVVALVVAYRRQRVLEYSARLEHGRERREDVRVLNERFATAASQLGSDSAAVRLAGVYAMAGLADDWSEQRQTIIDVLCAFLRMPYAARPEGEDSSNHAIWLHQRMVRHTVIRVIANHLQAESPVSWHGHDFDFSDAVFDGGDFADCYFSNVSLDFTGALFIRGETSFIGSRFSDCEIKFDWAQFSGGHVNFSNCDILDGCGMSFIAADIGGGMISFGDAEWIGSRLSGGSINFSAADLKSKGSVLFFGSQCKGTYIGFAASHFLGGRLSFLDAELSGGKIHFESADLKSGTVDFEGSDFIGSEVDFRKANFLGAKVSFKKHGKWTVQPIFDKWKTTPPGLQLPSVDVDA
jgi:uncharacterized protein YjbI with pentapeptide repeats